MKTNSKNVRKMKKSELQESLYHCPRFRLEKRGAFEFLGVMCKDALLDYYLEYCV